MLFWLSHMLCDANNWLISDIQQCYLHCPELETLQVTNTTLSSWFWNNRPNTLKSFKWGIEFFEHYLMICTQFTESIGQLKECQQTHFFELTKVTYLVDIEKYLHIPNEFKPILKNVGIAARDENEIWRWKYYSIKSMKENINWKDLVSDV